MFRSRRRRHRLFDRRASQSFDRDCRQWTATLPVPNTEPCEQSLRPCCSRGRSLREILLQLQSLSNFSQIRMDCTRMIREKFWAKPEEATYRASNQGIPPTQLLHSFFLERPFFCPRRSLKAQISRHSQHSPVYIGTFSKAGIYKHRHLSSVKNCFSAPTARIMVIIAFLWLCLA